GVRENLLRLLGERQLLRGGDALHEHAVALDLAPDVVRLHVEAREDLLDDLLPLAQDAEEDVLRFDDLRAQLRSFVAGEEEGAASFFVVLFEHRSPNNPQPKNRQTTATKPSAVSVLMVAQRRAHSASCVTRTTAPARSFATSARRSK